MNLLNNQQKINELVFANRNKNYGAYAIRSAYGNTVFKSLFIVFSTLSFFIGLGIWLKDKKVYTEVVNEQILISEFNMEDIYEVIPEKTQKPEAAKSNNAPVNNNTGAVSINENAADTTTQHLNNENLVVTNTGTETGGNTEITSGGGGNGNGTETNHTNTQALDLFAVDESPEFEGGLKALQQFVAKNLRYPHVAASEGKQGTLYVKFVVNEKGKVSDVLIQNNLGYGLDEEALRVIKLIPDFKSPGKVKGRAVKTNYQLPIKFKLG